MIEAQPKEELLLSWNLQTTEQCKSCYPHEEVRKSMLLTFTVEVNFVESFGLK